MKMDIGTSTPIALPKNFEPSSHLQEVSTPWKLNPQLWSADHKNEVKIKVSDSWYGKVDGPCYISFQNEIPDPRDSFFDRRASCVSTPIPLEKESSPLSTPNSDIVRSLKRCSISRIDDLSEGDSTLKAFDCTVQEFRNSKNSILSISPDPQRRLSRQSLTTVKPFSFELREKERRERLEAKQHYINILKEQYKTDTFKAKPSSKFKATSKVNDTIAKVKLSTQFKQTSDVGQSKETVNGKKAKIEPQLVDKFKIVKVSDKGKVENVTKKKDETEDKMKSQTPSITGQVNKCVEMLDKKEPLNSVKVNLPAKINDKPPVSSRMISSRPLGNMKNVQVKNTLQVENKKEINDSHNKQLVKPWKQKPFQICLPKRTVCIPRSPKLRTAQRARARQLFDDKLRERGKFQEEMMKKDATAKEKHEKQEIRKLRKQLVHKPLPVPVTNSKRTLTDPIIPIFVKRRKLNNQPNINGKTNKNVK